MLMRVETDWFDTLRRLPVDSRSMLSRERRFTLHCMISSIGHSVERSRDYDWNGLERGEREFGVFQLTLGGTGELLWKGREHQLEYGDAFLVRIPSDHRYYLPERSPEWEFVYVVVYGMEAMRILRHIESANGPVIPIGRRSGVHPLLVETFEYAIGEADHSAAIVSSFAYRLIMHLLDEIGVSGFEESDPSVRAAKAFARRHLHEDIGVAEMADIAGLSRSHFSRLFHQTEGMTAREYIEHLRIKNAMSLLAQRDMTIKEAAQASGFRDENYFTRVFKRATGLTPSEYRRAGA